MTQASLHVPGSKLLILGMAIPPLIGNPYNGYIIPYYWVEFPIPYHRETMGVQTLAHIIAILKKTCNWPRPSQGGVGQHRAFPPSFFKHLD